MGKGFQIIKKANVLSEEEREAAKQVVKEKYTAHIEAALEKIEEFVPEKAFYDLKERLEVFINKSINNLKMETQDGFCETHEKLEAISENFAENVLENRNSVVDFSEVNEKLLLLSHDYKLSSKDIRELIEKNTLTEETVRNIVAAEISKVNQQTSLSDAVEKSLASFEDRMSKKFTCIIGETNQQISDLKKGISFNSEIDQVINQEVRNISEKLNGIDTVIKSIDDLKYPLSTIEPLSKKVNNQSLTLQTIDSKVKKLSDELSSIPQKIETLDKDFSTALNNVGKKIDQRLSGVEKQMLESGNFLTEEVVKTIKFLEQKNNINKLSNDVNRLTMVITQDQNRLLQENRTIFENSQSSIEEELKDTSLLLREIQVSLENMDPVSNEKSKIELGNRITASFNEFFRKVDKNLNNHFAVFEKNLKKK